MARNPFSTRFSGRTASWTAAATGLALLVWAWVLAIQHAGKLPLTGYSALCEMSIAASLISLGWAVYGFVRSDKASLRWKFAIGLVCLGSAWMVSTFVGIYAISMRLSGDAIEVVTQTSGVLTYVAWPLALFLLPSRRAVSDRRLPWIMDVALIVTAISAAGWFFLIAPQITFTGNRFAFWLTFIFPLADMISLASVVAAITLGGPFKSSRGILMLAITTNVAGDVIQAVQLVHPLHIPASEVHWIWVLASVLGGIAAVSMCEDSTKPAPAAAVTPRGMADLGSAATPMLFLAALVALALWGNWARPNTRDALGLDLCCAIATVCALVRLSSLLQDNRILAESLAKTNESLDEQVRDRTSELYDRGKELERQRAFLRSVIDTIPSFVVAKTADETVVLANNAAGELFGRTAEALTGADYVEVASVTNKDAGDVIRPETFEVLQGGTIRVAEREIIAANGDSRVYEISKTPILGREGRPEQVLVVGNEITVRKEAERALIRAKEAAEGAMRLKTQFLANVSHEIRTPMNGIIGFTDLLLSENLSQQHRDLAISIRANSEGLLQIINDILDVSRLEAGDIRVQECAVSVDSLIREVVESFRIRSSEVALEWHVDIEPSEPGEVLADGTRIRQVLSHLLSNSVKFTPSGSISVRSDVSDRVLTISVSDTGIGIPEESLERIFETFAQVDNSATRRYGGTGLGLYLCRRLLNLLGGSLSVKSAVGVGSCFTIELPVKLCAGSLSTSRAGAVAHELRGTTVLVVEDNPVNQKVIVRLLERYGCEVQVAENGLAALEKLPVSAFDVVLMDCQMPVMDGYEATRQIRVQFGGRLPVIAVTAHASEGDREKCLAAGMNDYVTKPIRSEILAASIERALALRFAA